MRVGSIRKGANRHGKERGNQRSNKNHAHTVSLNGASVVCVFIPPFSLSPFRRVKRILSTKWSFLSIITWWRKYDDDDDDERAWAPPTPT